MEALITKQITFNQFYELWSSEPEVIEVFDLRPQEEYQRCHIPGAKWMSAEEFFSYPYRPLPEWGRDRLLVLVGGQLLTSAQWAVVKESTNMVVLDGAFQSFQNQGYPVYQKEFNCRDFLKFKKRGSNMQKQIIFHQLFEHESSTYTYLLADPETREAVIIDPVVETVDRDLKLIREMDLRLLYVLETHVHADHITAASILREKTGAKTVVSSAAKVDCADVNAEEGQELHFGSFVVKALETPGHTDGCMSYYVDGKVFTGDALLIRGTGRTDFQQGSSEKLYESITKKLFTLPDDTVMYPGHDYRGHTSSTIGQEKKLNPRVGGGRTQVEFVQIMKDLSLANPKKIHEAVPANMLCGRIEQKRVMHPQVVNGVPEVTVADVFERRNQVKIIDVRTPEEFAYDLGRIQGAKLATLGADLDSFLTQAKPDEEIVFVCRSGGRSEQATRIAMQKGFKLVMNMAGGMMSWNAQRLPVAQ